MARESHAKIRSLPVSLPVSLRAAEKRSLILGLWPQHSRCQQLVAMHLSGLASGCRQDWLCAAIYLLPLLDEYEGPVSMTCSTFANLHVVSQHHLSEAYQRLPLALVESKVSQCSHLGFAVYTGVSISDFT